MGKMIPHAIVLAGEGGMTGTADIAFRLEQAQKKVKKKKGEEYPSSERELNLKYW